ncbi:MAG: flavodoxin-dependent (E)-4-hydroxy-3-methylbut-2-enyl-diphosphate synthase [Candidatus Brocadiae bacterium]|nr:flavodoxin-dependent (E)-4-hydroxy-3-methylbut-2-enyl-diphosphate synthase [Candidatus Brocadiia bacterium]
MPTRNPTRSIRIGRIRIGGGEPIAVQSMCSTHTSDVDQTVWQCEELRKAGAGVVRVAVDNQKDVDGLAELRKQTTANLAVDIQENYPLIEKVAPHVDKIRYNPGHIHHLQKNRAVGDKVAWIAKIAADHGLAIRVGVNCGSVAPEFLEKCPTQADAIVDSALFHCDLLDRAGFSDYCVSLKDSDPAKVVDVNRRFAERRPDVPLHLGVTEAGLPPDGVVKTRIAFEQLITRGIGDTIRVSLTLPNEAKAAEVVAGHQILDDIEHGRFRSVPDFGKGLNIISCPSCSRVENEAFINLAQQVKVITEYAKAHKITIAVMGCRVNGPGETDDADLGLWCGPSTVNLKKRAAVVGTFGYDVVLDRLKAELDSLIARA